MKLIFIISGLICCYSYFIYPLLLKLIPAKRSLQFNYHELSNFPKLSLIITAHNEESRIKEKLENSLEIDYPVNSIEIIVASDCSTDRTDTIVATYANRGVRLVRANVRKGKEYAQLCAINKASGDILVFSDVATMINKDALRKLVARFIEPNIGAISSEDRFLSQNGQVVGEGAYVKYEMWLRRLESERAGLVGLSGSFFAARRSVCDEWDISLPSDFSTALSCAKNGLVAVTLPEVVGVYQDVKDPAQEYRRKTRTVIRGLTAIIQHPEVLNPFRMGLFAFQVWSHKIMRWVVPWFMLSLFISSTFIIHDHIIYLAAFIAQLIFYSIVLLGHFSITSRTNIFVKIPYFFVQVNIAIAGATLQFLMGKRIIVWEPSKR